MSDAKHPVVGEVVIDASDLKLIQTTTTKTRTFSRVRPGYVTAVDCVSNLPPALLSRAGISAEAVAELKVGATNYGGVAAFLPVVARLHELLKSSAQGHGDKVSNALSNIAHVLSSRARHDDHGEELLAAGKDLLEYVAEPSKKGVDTKRKTGVLKPKAVKHPKKAAAKTAATTNGAGTPMTDGINGAGTANGTSAGATPAPATTTKLPG